MLENKDLCYREEAIKEAAKQKSKRRSRALKRKPNMKKPAPLKGEKVETVERQEYRIVVKTNEDRESDQTEIILTIFGSENDSQPLLLKDSLSHEVPFRQGQIDTFIIDEAKLGQIKAIKIGHSETITS
jgi:hypothetical protein